MNPIATDNVLIDGKRIAHGVYGEGEPIVLLHGTPSSSLIWRNVVPQLVGAGYRVHLFDLLGYGHSERPRDPSVDTSISAQVPVLEALMDHWGLETAHIVAHDFGGGIAQRLGVFHPRRLQSLTLIDVVSYDSYPSPRTRQQMAAGLERLIKVPDDEHRAHFREWLLTAVHDPQRFESSTLETYLDFISGPIGQASLFQHQIRHYDPKHTLEVAARLPELGRIPVKLIWGADDAWQSVDYAYRLHADIPGSDLSVLEECGHFSPEDRPEEIARLVIEFLKR
ncbi:MAG: alpha/beta hydrolase [Salinicola sp.]|uniref:alpha/beta fold hydrolase n=1 Tax=uncultured Salinicola sp. TaxID=1193542 RepID=UPI000C939841|nr:alpha/beta hydrolase [uncultured Salinicola sp.]MAM59663.1 alpha/beta hydrolase [Salinicola sp.]|tara:strand:- start:535 stop:1377 length:843 start_codon:yes stop_codon:yes gene_type:complete